MRPQLRGKRIAHCIVVPFLAEIDMCDLTEGMHARVRASRPADGDFFAAKGFHCRGQYALHGRLPGLNLPPGKWSAVIFNQELVTRHIYCRPGRAKRGPDPYSAVYR